MVSFWKDDGSFCPKLVEKDETSQPETTKVRTRMEFDWSEQSAHIRTLYAPWQPGDGYEEKTIVGAEARLGVRLPAPLRVFYQAWGQRKDFTQTHNSLLGPAELVGRPDALIFCAENQGVSYWAIQQEHLEQANPPVVRAEALHDWHWSDASSPLVWEPGHAHLSDFLDTITYLHAFCGGAIHGGWGRFQPRETHGAWLEQHWHRIKVRPMALQLADGYDPGLPEYLDIYGRHGQALDWFPSGCSAVTSTVEALDEIGQVFQVAWTHRW